MERRLAAILAADIVDYSRLMGEDEARTLAALAELRRELFEPVVTLHGGKVIKRMGDGWIVEYSNTSDAIASAIEVQENLSNHEIIQLRIGVHIGDVTFQDEDIYGDGINVAARLEALAGPGQVLISDTAHHSLDAKAAAMFDGGENRQLKNIARPVAVWCWPTGSQTTASATVALVLPDKPSIAVLPFVNMSNDLEQEYFSDGMTEDIITALSRLRWLFVIARNSSFTYRGQAVDVKEVGRNLGVRYVLEGSVRKAASRVRVTAQLIDAETGNHIWAEKYDRELTDIFSLQDELTEAISTHVNSELAGNERQIAQEKPTNDLKAWDLYQRGMWHFYKYTPDGLIEARRFFQRAADQSPKFAYPIAGLAMASFNEVILGHAKDSETVLREGLRFAEQAVALDSRDGYTYYALGRISAMLGAHERAISAAEKAIELNPSAAHFYYGLGFALIWSGRASEAVAPITRAIRLSPQDPQIWTFYHLRGVAHMLEGDFEHGIGDAKSSVQAKSNEFWPYLYLAWAYTELGREDAARAALERTRDLNPDISVGYLQKIAAHIAPNYMHSLLEGLRKAGISE